jgi:protein-tyrosine phosphatase
LSPSFVDIHSHVLHGLDDGAKTLEESVEMLRMAAAAGTTDIVATPHANSRYAFNPDIIDQRIAALQPHTTVRIHRGCDFHLHFNNIQDALAQPEKYTINHKGYLLVEFPEMTVFAGTDDILTQLLDAGMMPIITHPERNTVLQRRVDDLVRWVEMGCYVQVTAGSCLGKFGKRAKTSAFELLDAGLVHFIASDAHNTEQRSPRLDEAFAELVNTYGKDSIQALFVDNPAVTLTGEPLEIDLPDVRLPPPRRWFEFWK